jgi:hypothetical protein
MADYAIWATACETMFGLKDGAFMEAYSLNREEVHQMALANSVLGQIVQKFVEETPRWQGSATELLKIFSEMAGEQRHVRGWPSNAQKLSGQLTRLSPNLRAIGIDVSRGKPDRNHRCIMIKPVA